MTKIPFTAKGYLTNECLELVHTNVCRPFNIHAWGYIGTLSLLLLMGHGM